MQGERDGLLQLLQFLCEGQISLRRYAVAGHCVGTVPGRVVVSIVGRNAYGFRGRKLAKDARG